jgi:hypothetical protein
MTCKQCGECCRYLALYVGGLERRQISYLTSRGVPREGDFFLIPHTCIHLVENQCNINDEKPHVCRQFKGQKEIMGWKVYTPPCCGYKEKV